MLLVEGKLVSAPGPYCFYSPVAEGDVPAGLEWHAQEYTVAIRIEYARDPNDTPEQQLRWKRMTYPAHLGDAVRHYRRDDRATKRGG